MTILSRTRTLSLVFIAAVLAGQPVVWADELESIRFGESALAYASGAIQRITPQDGFVNVITGDNQTTGDHMQLGQGDTLYIKLNNPADAVVGDLYTVFKRSRKVFHPLTNEYMGYLVNRLAIVQVVQVDKALTTVQAIRAFGAVSPGDPIVKFSLPTEPEASSDQSPSSDVPGMIIELQADMGLTLVAQRNVVYIDRGRDDGLRSGDLLEVIRSGGNLPPRLVGEIKVLSTEGKTSSALVTKSTARIFKGDRLRAKVRTTDVVPVSQPAQPLSQSPQLLEALRTADNVPKEKTPGNIQAQNASRETRITLNDLMKQLRYESGEATIKPEGYRVLDELVEYLKGAPVDQLIRVEGHADNMEIGPSLKSSYPTNWDLSKARATGVLRYLVEKGGIDSARISSVGYGDTKPVVSNATETGRQKNRRVDIVLYSPEAEKGAAERAIKQTAAGADPYAASGLGSESQGVSMNPAVPGNAVMDAPAPIRMDSGVPASQATGDQPPSDQASDLPMAPQP
jgi:chemotaxis protein MotB